jgi:prepilin signal peptidase PulO-like enzyme (type II secretory pathway)
MTILYIMLGSSAFIMMLQDVQKQTIPLYGLIVFAAASFYHSVMIASLKDLWAAGIIFFLFIICQGIYYLLKRKPIVGWGDIFLGPLCGLWLQSHEIPLYFVSSGVIALLIGLFWWHQWKMKTFPLTPALLAGLGFIFLNRCFLATSGL